MQNKEKYGIVMSVLSFPKKEAGCPASFFLINTIYFLLVKQQLVKKHLFKEV